MEPKKKEKEKKEEKKEKKDKGADEGKGEKKKDKEGKKKDKDGKIRAMVTDLIKARLLWNAVLCASHSHSDRSLCLSRSWGS